MGEYVLISPMIYITMGGDNVILWVQWSMVLWFLTLRTFHEIFLGRKGI